MTSSPLQSGAVLIGSDGRPTMYFLRWLNELRLGSSVTSDDATTVIAGQLASATAQIATLERRLAALEGSDVVVQQTRPTAEDRVIWQAR